MQLHIGILAIMNSGASTPLSATRTAQLQNHGCPGVQIECIVTKPNQTNKIYYPKELKRALRQTPPVKDNAETEDKTQMNKYWRGMRPSTKIYSIKMDKVKNKKGYVCQSIILSDRVLIEQRSLHRG